MNSKIIFYSRPFPYVKTYKQMIDCALSHGLTAVEGFCQFDLETPDTDKAKEIKKYADSKNVIFPCFSLYSNLTSENSKEEIERAKRYAEIASILGSPYLHHTITPESVYPKNVLKDKDKHFEKGILAVREIYDFSEKIGVKTIYEDQGYIFNGVDNFRNFLSEVDRDVGVVADFGNIYQSNNSIEEFISAFSNKICHVHIKDISITDCYIKNKSLPSINGKFAIEVEVGKGIINFKKCFKMLKEAGYNGYYSLEYSATDDNSNEIKFALEKIEKTIKDVNELL